MNILFLGASNTDCDHCFTSDNLGNGYVKMTHETLRPVIEQNGDSLSVTNGGTNGFTFPRIYDKYQKMYALNSYDLIVILGGINEAGVIHNTGLNEQQKKKYLDDSYHSFCHLLEQIRFNSFTKILIIEPFLFSYPSYLQLWIPTLKEIQSMIYKGITNLIGSNDILYLLVQEEFNKQVSLFGTSQISSDGIHLTAAGHQFLAEKVSGAVLELFNLNKF